LHVSVLIKVKVLHQARELMSGVFALVSNRLSLLPRLSFAQQTDPHTIFSLTGVDGAFSCWEVPVTGASPMRQRPIQCPSRSRVLW
jgi:hypothetical protein